MTAQNTVSDPIAFQLFRHALVGVANEMALTIYRTAYSGVLKSIMDYSTAICDAEGRLAAQGLSLPGHICSIPVALRNAIEKIDEPIEPDDILLMNDPYSGGMHLPDIFTFKPVFVGGRLIAWVAAVCHHTDVGGRVAGSNASDSTEIYQEGVRIPPLKLQRRGRINQTLMTLLEANVRAPARLKGDLRGQMAACRVAELGVQALAAAHGIDRFCALTQELMNYSERMTRAGIAALPDGDVTFTDYIDDDGIDIGIPIPLVCRIIKTGDKMVIDWTGTAPQVKGAINNTYSYTAAASYTAVKTVLGDDAPNNDGVFRAIEVIAPEGTVANAKLPAACAARGLTGFRMSDCAFGALAKLLPGRVFACGDGGNTCVTIGGWSRDRKPFIYVDFISAAWGGRPTKDGLEGNTTIFANMASYSIEVVEGEQPILITANEYISDSGGPGKWRGGMALRRDWQLLEETATLQVRADRQTHAPWGLEGGKDGRVGVNKLNPGTERSQILPGKFTIPMKKADVFSHQLPSGGGWGDPLDRDPVLVAEDYLDDCVSMDSARTKYGVVIDQAGVVDMKGTEALRAEMRSLGRRSA